jgi:hypothetical protein
MIWYLCRVKTIFKRTGTHEKRTQQQLPKLSIYYKHMSKKIGSSGDTLQIQ